MQAYQWHLVVQNSDWEIICLVFVYNAETKFLLSEVLGVFLYEAKCLKIHPFLCSHIFHTMTNMEKLSCKSQIPDNRNEVSEYTQFSAY